MRFLAILSVVVCASLAGCTDSTDQGPSVDSAKTSSVSYVCVGMETSQRFGNCPGCKYDSDRMHKLLGRTFGYSGVLLQSETATKAAVVSALEKAISNTPESGLFIFYYSGHGGREFLNTDSTSEPDGADDADEYLCLYDTYLLDDDLWSMITKCRGRVFLVFDCCHSQTMFRSVVSDGLLAKGLAVPLEDHIVTSSGFNFKPVAVALGLDEGCSDYGHRSPAGNAIRMLCWSGCTEAEYSYGSRAGGVMTNSIMSRWRSGISYDDLWSKVSKDVTLIHSTQHPTATKYGGVFKEAFR